MLSGTPQRIYHDICDIIDGGDEFLKLNKNDTFIVASPVIPGTEKIANKAVNELYKTDSNIHVLKNKELCSMHASQEDIKVIIQIFNPTYFVPVKGEYQHFISNLEVAKKENSVILIEDNYEQRYAGFNPNSSESYIIFEFVQDKNMEKSVKLATLIQKQFKNTAKRIDKGVHQAGFLVLRATSMPSVLVELGYISTPDEEQYLLSDAGTTALSNSIYKAFLNYKREHDAPTGRSRVQGQELPEPENKPKESRIEIQTAEPDTATEPDKVTKKPVPATQKKITGDQARTSAKPVFKIQILVSNKILPKGSKQLKGVSPVSYYREKGLYKYTYGESTDYNKILRMKRNITPKFKDAFIIAFKNGEKMNVNEAIKEFKKNR